MTKELNHWDQRIKTLMEQVGHPDSMSLYQAFKQLQNELTQRPAAQAGEREVFEAWADANVQSDYSKSDRHCMWWGWQARASLPAQPAAQDEREADEVFLPRRLAATQKLTQLGYRYDSAHGKWLPAPQQATPEPDDAQRRFEAGCVVLEYLRDIGAPYRAVHHMLIALHGDPEAKSKATPEPVGEAVAWWYIEDGEEKFGHPNGYRPDDARPLVFGDTRPAPGVPEGWRDAFDLAAQMLTWGRDEGLTPEQVNEVDAHAKLMFAMLAAQAKGGDHG